MNRNVKEIIYSSGSWGAFGDCADFGKRRCGVRAELIQNGILFRNPKPFPLLSVNTVQGSFNSLSQSFQVIPETYKKRENVDVISCGQLTSR